MFELLKSIVVSEFSFTQAHPVLVLAITAVAGTVAFLGFRKAYL
jgi:hypothetical protein